jgi:lipopolysaccharide/colanic/teichoic acid biosynthesis glycosyltransferase
MRDKDESAKEETRTGTAQLPAREQPSPPRPELDSPPTSEPSAEWLDRVLSDAASRTRSHGRWWRDARRRRLLALADCCAATAALAIAVPPERAIWLVAFVPVWILVAKLAGLYDHDHRSLRHLTVDEAPAIAAWGVIGVVIADLLGQLTPAGDLSTTELAVGAAAAITLDILLRVIARAIWRLSTPREQVLVVGNGDLAQAMRRKLALFGDLHMEAVEPGNDVAGIDRVVLAHERADAGEIARIADLCRHYEAHLSLVSPLRGQATPQSISRLAELPVFEYGTSDVSRSTMLLKRALDLIVGLPMMLLAAPLFPLIALAIWLEDRGPALFVQTRVGLNGKPFRLFKFRTMQVGAERSLADLVQLDELPEPMFKLRSDPRVTRVGRVLRRLSLDEIPQLWNLVRGDMSLVGPRPEQEELVERYSPEHRFRLSVKPGLTGPMQIHGRGELTFSERLAVELDYVENLSLGRDLRILALTPVSVIRGTGAF